MKKVEKKLYVLEVETDFGDELPVACEIALEKMGLHVIDYRPSELIDLIKTKNHLESLIGHSR